MSSEYTKIYEHVSDIKNRLDTCIVKLQEITSNEKEKYKGAQNRKWNGDVNCLEYFIKNLEECLNQPLIAEAKGYLSDIKKWSEPGVSLKEIEKDGVFLSGNVSDISEIYQYVKNIQYEGIRKKITTYILERVNEKDVAIAKKWALNANCFSIGLSQFEKVDVKTELAKKVKEEGRDNLLKETSFDKDKDGIITEYKNLISKAEALIASKPKEVSEELVVLEYNEIEDSTKNIKEKLDRISLKIETIRRYLINLEWVKELEKFKEDYKNIWEEKQKAIESKNIEDISNALDKLIQKANKWKESKQEYIDDIFLKLRRVISSLENENDGFLQKLEKFERQKDILDWDSPDVKVLSTLITTVCAFRNELKKICKEKLQNNQDAITIIEEPEIIKDLGQSKGWNFEQFFDALKIVLQNNLIEIEAVKNK